MLARAKYPASEASAMEQNSYIVSFFLPEQLCEVDFFLDILGIASKRICTSFPNFKFQVKHVRREEKSDRRGESELRIVPFCTQMGQDLALTVLAARHVLILLVNMAKPRLLSMVVGWRSGTSSAVCDGEGKSEKRKADQREAKTKKLTKLILYILDGI